MGSAHAHEVEVKFKLDHGDLHDVATCLKQAGLELGPVTHQDDQAFAPIGWDYGQDRVGVPFARLRTDETHGDGACLFTIKRPVDNTMACLEAETVVNDRDAMARSLELMGWRPTVRIVKTRRSAEAAGGLTVCLDVVDHAGVFLEVEKLAEPDTEGIQLQTRLEQWVRDLGINASRCEDTYDTLVRNALAGANAYPGT
ncbi:class IV adenylate cyclase [Phytomonospora endophytica]|uniref:Adenylate cyclase class 2 n=1 Tax=Phytomonospora endophytica TaxID=714109 RepID=A0A841G669_9ACTN|nr:CYTH domain-containing protein [Phytomonospora endophytica]MBB6039570.1 adenylate cyclase class 2 [Phytomonospora endophytica]GIG70536.1 hypothetical protein Pen01_68310 [Phytomonospora endophytica]